MTYHCTQLKSTTTTTSKQTPNGVTNLFVNNRRGDQRAGVERRIGAAERQLTAAIALLVGRHVDADGVARDQTLLEPMFWYTYI
jgi:hypothetical protein